MVKFILWGKAAECRFFLFYSAFAPRQTSFHDAQRHFTMRSIISSSAQLSISRHTVSFHPTAGGLPTPRRPASFHDAQHHFKLGTAEHFKTRSVISHHPGGLPTSRRPASFHDAQHHFKLAPASISRHEVSFHSAISGLPTSRNKFNNILYI